MSTARRPISSEIRATVAIMHGSWRYLATVYADARVAMARRHIDRPGYREYGHGAWAGVILVDEDARHWPRQAVDRLSADLRDSLDPAPIETTPE